MPEIERVREREREKEKEKEVERKEVEKEVEKEEMLEACPECGSPRLIRDYRRGEFICQDCGLVLEDTYIDEGPEWRGFDSEQKDKRSRVGAPVTYTIHDKGLSTTIGGEDKDVYGKAISGRNKAQLLRLRKWQRRTRISNATERDLTFALSELDRIASALGLPRSVRETAAVVYRKAVGKNLIRGRSIEDVITAALYAACRRAGIPRPLDEIVAYSKVDRKEVARTYRFIARELSLKLMPTSPADYVPRFCATLGLSGEVQKKAVEIIKKAEEREITSGRGPTGVAAAAIYIASILGGERRTQAKVAEVAGVTEVTIRNRYKELAEKLEVEIIL